MNDFTLEELKNLLSCVNGEIRHNINSKTLEEKLRAMISDYCDHNWVKGVHLFNDVFCTNCHKSFRVKND